MPLGGGAGAGSVIEASQPPPTSPDAPVDAATELARWYAAVGPRRPGEPFGALVLRAAEAQLGASYEVPPWHPGEEVLEWSASRFSCVTLIEGALAVARCTWRDTPDKACFLAELTAGRYRDGTIAGWSSRLHYWEDWLDEAARHGRVEPLTVTLGGNEARRPTHFITSHQALFPALADPAQAAAMARTEARLSSTPFAMLPRARVAAALTALEDGDIVTIASTTPGLLVMHVGFATRDESGVVRMLHASSLAGRVVVTPGDISAYLALSPRRAGVLVDRPLAPPEPQAAP